jgi:peptidoglycan-N-acetylglucosamine deacetylase
MTMNQYQWPGQKKCAVAISFDFDGETPFLWRNRQQPWGKIGELEQRKFGPRQGIYRILDLLRKWNIQATFFVPGYIAEHYPKAIQAITADNHEIGLHGYVHEKVDELSVEEVEKTIVDAKAVIENMIQKPVKGYRSPSWEMTHETIDLLKKHKLTYDSSLMGYDHPYSMDGLTEIPVQWLLDDAIFYRYVGGGGQNPPVNPKDVIDSWKQEFYGLKQYGGLFLLTMHPWISGRASRLLALDGFLGSLRNDPDVWWTNCEEIAEYHQHHFPEQYRESSVLQMK